MSYLSHNHARNKHVKYEWPSQSPTVLDETNDLVRQVMEIKWKSIDSVYLPYFGR